MHPVWTLFSGEHCSLFSAIQLDAKFHSRRHLQPACSCNTGGPTRYSQMKLYIAILKYLSEVIIRAIRYTPITICPAPSWLNLMYLSKVQWYFLCGSRSELLSIAMQPLQLWFHMISTLPAKETTADVKNWSTTTVLALSIQFFQ